MLTISNVLLLILVAIIGGTLNGIVGMATLVLYPALLFVGVPPISADATITVGLLFSGISSVTACRKELRGNLPNALKIALFVGLGSIIGAILLKFSSESSFKDIIPIVIFISGILIILPNHRKAGTKTNPWFLTIAVIALTLIGVYCGYFGAGAGVLMTAVLSRLIDRPYKDINAIRNVATLAANIIASLIFIFTIPINWIALLVIALALPIGGYLGPVIVRYIPSQTMKWIISIFAIVLAIVLGIQAYY